MGTSARDHRSEAGATMVENAIVLPVFVLVLFAIIDLCHFSYQALTLQYGVSRVLRTVAIHTGDPNVVTRNSMIAALHAYGVHLAASDSVTLCPITALGPGCPANSIVPGDQHELMVLRIGKNVPSFILGGLLPRSLSFSAEAVGRNEPI